MSSTNYPVTGFSLHPLFKGGQKSLPRSFNTFQPVISGMWGAGREVWPFTGLLESRQLEQLTKVLLFVIFLVQTVPLLGSIPYLQRVTPRTCESIFLRN